MKKTSTTATTRPVTPHALAAIAAEAKTNNYKEIEVFYTVRGGKVTKVLLYGIQRGSTGPSTFHDINPYYSNCPDFLAAWAYENRGKFLGDDVNLSITLDTADFFRRFAD